MHLYFVYFQLYVYFECSPTIVPLKNDTNNTRASEIYLYRSKAVFN